MESLYNGPSGAHVLYDTYIYIYIHIHIGVWHEKHPRRLPVA